MALRIILFLLQIQLFKFVSSQNVTKFPALFVFGDSTADSGNNNYISTTFKANHLPYGQDFPGQEPTGRFSNGKLVPDFWVSLLGIKETIPPYLDPNISDDDFRTGVNFASAGSGFDDVTAHISQAIPMSKQLQYFKDYIRRLKKLVGAKQARRIIRRGLVSITAGTNDFTISFYDVQTRRADFNIISDYQDFVLYKLQTFVHDLYKLGSLNMVINGLPPMGCIPIQMTAKFKDAFERRCIEEQNTDAMAYNQKLIDLVSQMQASLLGTTIVYTDTYRPMMNMIRNPQKHGFSETKVGCCGTGFVEAGAMCTLLTPMCTNASKYLFFDSVHPTEAAYRYITKNLIKQLILKL